MKYLFTLIVVLGLFFSVAKSFADDEGTGKKISELCASVEKKEDASTTARIYEDDKGNKFLLVDGKLKAVTVEK